MIGDWLRRLTRGTPQVREATTRDAAAMADLHAASFRRGWSESEFEQLLADRSAFTHSAHEGRKLAGFIASRCAADEAEILSVAVSKRWRSRGLGGTLLRHHLGRMAARGVTAVFLEVDEDNTAARRLYDRAGFREVARRAGYYSQGGRPPSAALVLRRDLA